MKRGKLIIAVGLVSILLLLISAGCGADAQKSSQHSSREEPLTEQVATSDEVDSSSEEADSTEDESAAENEDTTEDDATTDDEVAAEPTENPETNCSALNPHPLGESIAEQFDMTYDEVMAIYCDGYAFSDIMLALETEEMVDLSATELLAMIEDKSWEEIWDELGVEK